LGIIELRGLARRFAIKKAIGAPRIEAQHPIPNDRNCPGASYLTDPSSVVAQFTKFEYRRLDGQPLGVGDSDAADEVIVAVD
jgi:hypothetical protein